MTAIRHTLAVAIDGADKNGVELERGLVPVNTLEAGLEARDFREAQWRLEGWVRDGFNPVRFVRLSDKFSWRRAIVVKIAEAVEDE